jgi:hypothetical protein
MQMSKKIFLVAIGLLLGSQGLLAQCVMCKANAESSLNQGSSAAAGLNSGIEYILIMPYLLAAVIGGAFYYNYRKKLRNV